MAKALVVGGSTGIGRGIADAWAALGHEVTVYSRSEPVGDGAAELRWEQLDFRDPAQARKVLTTTVPARVELVCYSAIYYTLRRENFLDVGEEDWRDQLDINVHGLWLTLQATIPALRAAKPGVFLSVSSEVVYNAGPARSGYAATKAAAASLIGSVAQEEDADVIRFAQVMPAGMVESPGIRARRAPDFDYSGYMQPADFGPFATDLARAKGAGFARDVFIVEKGGGWQSITDGLPVSQSRPLGVAG
ncbi:SDR family NAD(P)-dependent oxidoreductase [Nocardia arthritidis]|uniref:SDR family NAD(P)-dependent oxidoreductase n=1 Tax=Nocardia arthritidis TaxID=228602 RepID=A0A6G9YF50_9NOCA|nr:SDR family oxidoreductase [Nocardia arthritidis]QIS11623.1 SDR family NAD(P)-dependent oxidoreductase [Nocardia arthritidis]